MAKVRGYEPGQVQANPLPSSRFDASASSDSFGGARASQFKALGQSLQNVSSGLQDAAVKFQQSNERKDRAVVRDNLNNAQSEARVFMSDLNRPENRQTAVDAYEKSQKQLTDIRRRYSSQLKNSRQQDLFTASFDDVMNGHLDRAIAIQDKARTDYEKETLAAQNQTAVEDAVASRTDPAAIRTSEVTIKANTAFENRGLPVPVRKKAVENAVHNLHASVLSALTLDSPVAAQEYLKQNWGKFNPAAREGLKKELDGKAFDFTVRQRAAEISNSGAPLEDQLKQADTFNDPKMADELRQRIKEKYDDKVLARKAQEQALVQQEWSALTQDPRGYQIPYEKFTDPEQWRAMEEYKRAALNGYSQSSDVPVLMKLGLMSDEQLKSIPVKEMAGYAHVLTEGDFKAVFDRYQSLNGGKGAKPLSDTVTQIRSDTALVNDALKSVGIDITAKDAKDKKKKQKYENTANEFYRAYQSELTQQEQKLGRKASPDEKQQVVDSLLIKGRVRNPDWFMLNDQDKFVFQVQNDEWKNFSVQEVPQEDQVKIVEALNRAGRPVTQEAVRNLYIKKLQGKRA